MKGDGQVTVVGQQVEFFFKLFSFAFYFILFQATRSGAMSESPIRRRTSISSSMEEIHPEHQDDIISKPIKGTLDRLSNTFNSLRGSFSSSHHDLDNTVWMARSDYAYDIRLLFKRRIRNLYIAFTNLRSYVEINYSGFRKIIKKYVFF